MRTKERKEEYVAQGKPKEVRRQKVEYLRQKARDMKKGGNPEWKLVCAEMKELMGRDKEARKDPRTEALRRKGSDLRMKAREAKAKGNIAWKYMHAKLRGYMDRWTSGKGRRRHEHTE